MMGSVEVIPEAPKKAPVFLEDLPEEDQEGAIDVIPQFEIRLLGLLT